MKITQYVRIERAIAAAAVNDIRERWLWGLRLLHDPDAFSAGSSQLKPGRTDELIRAARSAGLRLSEREIRYRIQVARAYPTESQIRHAGAEFESWSDLRSAGFPAYEAPDGEPPADYRTFEPVTTTLKELSDYAAEMAELTARFAARDKDRADYLEQLVNAVDGDLSATWQDAHTAAFGEDVAA